MEAQTLKINVYEAISVADVIADGIKRVAEFAKQVWNWLFSEEPDDEPQKEKDANRAPPALGINVAEEIKTNESLR